MSLKFTSVLMGAALCVIFSGPAFAKGIEPDRFELRAGFGYQFNNNPDLDPLNEVLLLPSMTVPISDVMGPSWFRGKFEWNPELYCATFTKPFVRPIIGITPLQFQYALEPIRRFAPYITGGAGVLWTNLKRHETDSHVNFNSQAALGVRYALTQRSSLIAEYRYTHVSNAGIREPNSGLNTNSFLVGISISN